MDWDDLRRQAKATPTGSMEIQPKRFLVAIALLGKPLVNLGELDFIWVRAHSKIKVEKLVDVFKQRQETGVDIQLQLQGDDLLPDTLVKNLDWYGDRLIVLRAVEKRPATHKPQKASPPTTSLEAKSPTPASRVKNEPGLPSPAPKLPTSTPDGVLRADTTALLQQNTSDFSGESAAGHHLSHEAPHHRPSDAPMRSQQPSHNFGVPAHPQQFMHYHSGHVPIQQHEAHMQERFPSGYPSPYTNAVPGQAAHVMPGGPALPLKGTFPWTGAVPPPSSQNTGRIQSYDDSAKPMYGSAHIPPDMSPRSRLLEISRRHRPVSPPDTAVFGPANRSTTATGSAGAEPYSSTIGIKDEQQAPPLSQLSEPGIPFDPDQFFKRDESPDGEDSIKPVDRFIREIMDQENPEILEAGVSRSLKVLESLKSTFLRYAASSPDASAWVEAIDKLCRQSERTRTVVGVVGNTGAGKSSVINALLDEERLVPTNCMRACTATISELSWNDSDDPGARYRASIEFITRTDWEKELRVLMTEFITESGTLSHETRDANSDAGIALAKFRAVYPKITLDTLAHWTVEKLMEEGTLNVLGTTKYIQSAKPDRFYTELQKYVDSKEKSTGKKSKDKDKNEKKPPAQTEYWPLIKVVKIYTKSDALSTGAVIVDLPGVHDSNAARAAVAERYMKQCTGLWIVAPITRAVDDKAAKNLLGATFKRQLKYDGNYSSVTMVCSKTDDISRVEATDSLQLEDQMAGLEEQERGYKKEMDVVNKQIDDLKETVQMYTSVMDDADNDIEAWEQLRDDAEEGKTVFAPPSKSAGKRKRGSAEQKPRKRQHQVEDDSDAEYISSGSDESDATDDSDNEGCDAPKEPLTLDEIKSKLDEIRQTKKAARQEKAIVRGQIPELKPKLRELKDKIAAVRSEMTALCIAKRNEYSRGAIQQDFAAGIRELDMEVAEEEDEAAFNPDEERRDYDEVARSLPVFCVSSRAYQKISGRLQKDENVPGFNTPKQTEMPQLQKHCKKMTEAGRIQACRKFLVNLVQQLTTFTLWASNDGTGLKMTDEDKQKQYLYLQKRLHELEKGLEQAVAACLRVMKKELHDQIFDRFPDLIDEAIKLAPATAHKWGYRHEGGLHYSTYKAVVRRNGDYTSASAGHRNFNAELVEPVLKRLATSWERAFANRLPKAFETYTKDSGKVLHAFHETIEARARENGVGLANLSMLKGSIYNYEQMFRDLNLKYLESMTEAQRNANRDFVPTIGQAMLAVYNICTDERGIGSYFRMKQHMETHVDRERHRMFANATQTVEQHLIKMCRELEEMMSNGADEIFAMMRADYMRVLGGVQVSAHTMPKEERNLRMEIKEILHHIDEQFERIAGGELGPDPEPAVENAKDEEMEGVQSVDGEDTKGAKVTEGQKIDGIEKADGEEEPKATDDIDDGDSVVGFTSAPTHGSSDDTFYDAVDGDDDSIPNNETAADDASPAITNQDESD